MKFSRRALRILVTLFITLIILLAGVFIFSSITTSVTKNADNYVYELPFQKGTSHRVVQGYGGLFSHTRIAALDFEMPVGTDVYASRDGIVYSYKDNSEEGGPFSKYQRSANYIIVKHKDGSFGCYWHLQKNGVLVKSGYISKGQKIGISGATGYLLYPHLHFSVKRKLNYDMNSFTRTKFRTTIGTLFLENGEIYERPLKN